MENQQMNILISLCRMLLYPLSYLIRFFPHKENSSSVCFIKTCSLEQYNYTEINYLEINNCNIVTYGDTVYEYCHVVTLVQDEGHLNQPLFFINHFAPFPAQLEHRCCWPGVHLPRLAA